ncbi:MAG: entericidin A/B family lipoprotein [Roseimicrobium sp.]
MKTSHKRLFLLLLASALGTLIGTSCNTMRGVGRDVQHAGSHIEAAAR